VTRQEKIDSLTTELTEVETAISYILKGGQEYTIQSGGGPRSTTNADLSLLYKRKETILSQISGLNRTRVTKMRPGW